MSSISTDKLEELVQNETFWFLIVSAIVLISSMKIACETYPIDPEASKILSEDDIKKSIPKWITENNLSWMIFFAGSVLCVVAYVFSSQTGKNELGVGLLAIALTGMLLVSIVFDQLIKLFQPKKEEFGSTEDETEHTNGIFYNKIKEFTVEMKPKKFGIRTDIPIELRENSLTVKIDGSKYYTGVIINKTVNPTIKVTNSTKSDIVNNKPKFILLSKELDPVQAILKGNGKGYIEDPESSNSNINYEHSGSDMNIRAGILSDGVYYLHAYEGKPVVLPNDDGFEIENSDFTNDGSGNYTSTGTPSEDFKETYKIAPLKIVIVSTNKLNVKMISGLSWFSAIVLLIGFVYYASLRLKKDDFEWSLENVINIFCPLISLVCFSIIGFGLINKDMAKDFPQAMFNSSIVAYVFRLIQVCYLFYGIFNEYQS